MQDPEFGFEGMHVGAFRSRDGYQHGTGPREGRGCQPRNGLTAWLECTTPATGCQDITSPGAFGFTPWIDRDGRYYAIVAMESQELGEISQFSVQLSLDLRPLIRAAVPR